ncbi:unnamed protein product, partial [Urochloa humidicola]
NDFSTPSLATDVWDPHIRSSSTSRCSPWLAGPSSTWPVGQTQGAERGRRGRDPTAHHGPLPQLPATPPPAPPRPRLGAAHPPQRAGRRRPGRRPAVEARTSRRARSHRQSRRSSRSSRSGGRGYRRGPCAATTTGARRSSRTHRSCPCPPPRPAADLRWLVVRPLCNRVPKRRHRPIGVELLARRRSSLPEQSQSTSCWEPWRGHGRRQVFRQMHQREKEEEEGGEDWWSP